MELKPELLQTMLNLGVDPSEIGMLMEKMLSAVTSRQAELTAIDAQISTLNSRRDTLIAELAEADITVAKLIVTE